MNDKTTDDNTDTLLNAQNSFLYAISNIWKAWVLSILEIDSW